MANYKPAPQGFSNPQGRSNGAVERLKAGEYPAQIIQVRVKFSKCGQFEQHSLRVRVEDAANELWEDFWENLTFSEKAMWKVEHVLSAVGVEVGVEREIRPEEWVEKRCRVVLASREDRMEIKRWLPAQRDSHTQREPVKRASVRDFPANTLSRLKAMPVPAGEDGLPF